MTDKNGIIKRSVNIAGHRTSITLEQPFWDSIKTIAAERRQPISRLIAEIDGQQPANLSSALRVFVLSYYKDKTTPPVA